MNTKSAHPDADDIAVDAVLDDYIAAAARANRVVKVAASILMVLAFAAGFLLALGLVPA